MSQRHRPDWLNQEQITEALGAQVRRAVELLVAAIGRADVRERERGGPSLADVSAHDVYRGAVGVMMRIVFVLFAEERKLLPSDNDLYAATYSAGRLRGELEDRVTEGREEDLEYTTAAWRRLLALFDAVYTGIDHPGLVMHAHDGSLFDPATHAWLPRHIDDRTVLHLLRAVQRVELGTGRSREVRTVSFRELDVEQIGYVYEGLLSFEGFRAGDVLVGLIGKQGLEEEVSLTDLEALPSAPAELAATLADRYKDSKIGSVAALTKRLGQVERVEAREKLLAVTGGDQTLAERLLPFAGIIREDLRGLPTVILAGAPYVADSALRKNTGTHYTPRFLAEEVVAGALEPLVYEPGPLQTADRSTWRRRSSKHILALRVADIAMGAAAFLVAAARYLGDHLIQAWADEGDEQAKMSIGGDEDPLVIEARRQIIEHCLYGADINPMAVEMAKLSLWLVSMDPRRPFTFLDDRLIAGDSLLGITSLDQLTSMHMDPIRGREVHEGRFRWADGVEARVHAIAETRRYLIEIAGDGSAEAHHKKVEILAEISARTEHLRLFADLTVGAALAGGWDGLFASAALHADNAAGNGGEGAARDQRRAWLATDHVPGTFEREPLHWPLLLPDVFERGGFDAVIGNPPFLGGTKISGALGGSYRDYLVANLAGGVRAGGRGDLVAYFVLRAHALLNPKGQAGLIATNTLAQGDTREIGLDRIVESGVTIRASVKSRPWPSRSAALEYCAVWTSRAGAAVRTADGSPVAGITTSLEPRSRATLKPARLATNAAKVFEGSKLDGIGFTMPVERAHELIRADPRNREVLLPFLNGKDVNSRPDSTASRWVIDFGGLSEREASTYEDCFRQVRELVKPVRALHSEARARQYWWRFQRRRPDLYQAISSLKRVITIARVSRTVMPVLVPTGQVVSEALVVVATDDYATLAVLSGAAHYWWAVSRASTMKADLRYTPSDVFETLPFPELTGDLRALGRRLHQRRRAIMLARDAGLTATYGLVNDAACYDRDIVALRRIHRDIDAAVCVAYGWKHLLERGFEHGFHRTGPYIRYTVGQAARREIVDLLVERNHERHTEETGLRSR